MVTGEGGRSRSREQLAAKRLQAVLGVRSKLKIAELAVGSARCLEAGVWRLRRPKRTREPRIAN